MKNGLLIAALVALGLSGLAVIATRVADDSIQQSPNIDSGDSSSQVESIALTQHNWIKAGPKTVEVKEPVEIERILKCFPDVLARPKSNVLGGWQPDVTIRIDMRNKTQLKVEFSTAFPPNGIWRNDKGDFPAESGTIEVIGGVFKERVPADL